MSLKVFIRVIVIWISISQLQCSHVSFFSPKTKSLKIGVVIGPGGAKALSSIGVLQSLINHNIPIDWVMGIGWGSWIGALFAKNKSIDEIKWSFHKLSKRGFFDQSFLKHPMIAKKISTLDTDLNENFTNQDHQIPFTCPSIGRNFKTKWRTQKSLKNSIEACLLIPPFFDLKDALWVASPSSTKESIQYLKDRKINVIIWIHSINDTYLFPKRFQSSDHFTLWSGIKNHFYQVVKNQTNVWIASPDLADFDMSDFLKINEIVLAGQKEGDFLVKKLQKTYPHLRVSY